MKLGRGTWPDKNIESQNTYYYDCILVIRNSQDEYYTEVVDVMINIRKKYFAMNF